MAKEKKRPKPADGSSPFEGMNIASHDALAALTQRSNCSECGSSRKYFCYTCYIPIPELRGKLPVVKLPVKVDIIKHSREVDGKSTAIHAAVLAPNDVNIYTYPSIPNYDDPSEKVVLVYPSRDAVSLQELTQRLSKRPETTKEQSEAEIDDETKVAGFLFQKEIDDETKVAGFLFQKEIDDKTKVAGCPFQKVVFIDCTWNQTNQISRDERLTGLPCVIIQDRKTCFWRGQNKADSYLATIEAIYYFMVDYQKAFQSEKESGSAGCYDNLLYFYSFMYGLVHRDNREDGKRKKEENG